MNFSSQLRGIRIICNQWSLPEWLYVRLLPLLLFFFVGRHWIGKSNQSLGAEIGLAVARKNHKFITRNGYLFSLNEERSHGKASWEAKRAHSLERRLFVQSDKIVVTTESMKEKIIELYHTDPHKIVVIPNYVDIDLFTPLSVAKKRKFTIGFVGRLVKNKNPEALLQAIQGLDIRLVMVGGGQLAKQLEELAKAQGSELQIMGILPNNQIPAILNQCDLFVLPSLYEGHPKSLLEAMACGLAVIATDVPGNRELIRHEVDGILCGTSRSELRQAILMLNENATLRRRLGQNARRRVVEEFSLDRIAKMEMDLLREMSAS